MDQHILLKPTEGWETLDYLSIISEERAGRIDVLAIESGVASIRGRSEKGCFVVFDDAFGFYFGMRPFIGVLKWAPHPLDFMISISEVTALHISGATKETAPQHAYDPRLHLQTGQSFLQVTSKKHGAVQFAPSTTKTMAAAGVLASKILAGHRTVYSDHVRGKAADRVKKVIEERIGLPIGHRPEDVLPMASRYLPHTETFDVGIGSYVLPCRRRMDDDLDQAGYLVFEQGHWGFFEPSDIETDWIAGRSPLIGKVSKVNVCSLEVPRGVSLTPSDEDVAVSVSQGSDTIWMMLNSPYAEFIFDWGSLNDAGKTATLTLLQGIVERICQSGDLFHYDFS